MLIGQGAVDACKVGVTIAVRYACARPQFGEQFIMSYLTHQRRLLPALATTYALHLVNQRCKARAAGCCRSSMLSGPACFLHPLPLDRALGLAEG